MLILLENARNITYLPSCLRRAELPAAAQPITDVAAGPAPLLAFTRKQRAWQCSRGKREGDPPIHYFHFNARFGPPSKIVFNTISKDKWEKEEFVKNPLKPGDSFKLEVLFDEDKYTVYLDDNKLGEFKARVHPLEGVKRIEVTDQASVRLLEVVYINV
ncbi:hypothetical protein GDO86_019936 [Hymenochirus boettgeri]|uniref:Galectin n=1 Tax=Hymenochirus boettgeri TaxID=247094 RepID=A0A8T2ICV1_9PIPI|nr:hypothetical protein GDO86_019936 [Hymenochirus boettgeri]